MAPLLDPPTMKECKYKCCPRQTEAGYDRDGLASSSQGDCGCGLKTPTINFSLFVDTIPRNAPPPHDPGGKSIRTMPIVTFRLQSCPTRQSAAFYNLYCFSGCPCLTLSVCAIIRPCLCPVKLFRGCRQIARLRKYNGIERTRRLNKMGTS